MTFDTTPEKPRISSSRIIVGAIILLIGTAWMLEVADAVDEIPWRWLLPAAVIVIGIGLIADARGRAHGGLIFLGVILTLLMLVDVSIRPFRFTSGETFIGPRTERPVAVEELEDYGIFAGDLRVDLSDLSLPAGETSLDVSTFAGTIRVTVPADVTVELEAGTMFGQVRAFGEQSEGIGPRVDKTFTGSDPSRVLVLDVSSFAGDIEVRR